MIRSPLSGALALLVICAFGIWAQAEDWKPIPRRLPPKGIAIPGAQRQQIEDGLKQLDDRLQAFSRKHSVSDDLLPDVQIYEKAVRFALLNDEFYKPQDFSVAMDLMSSAQRRLDELSRGEHPWTAQHGLVVRGYRSEIDGSAQPYGLEIPADLDLSKSVPLYVWLHGRGDQSTDLHFIRERQSRRGQIAPPGAIVVHPFGRQCLGFKSAGEIDVFEAIESVTHRYKIDPDRVVLMGFSMGGAGAWHLGAHYADRFAAVHAGAGFVDVVRYQKLTPDKYPAWYEQKLWGMYDVPDYVRNLFNVPTVGYGGELDPQRESSLIMSEAAKAEGRDIPRIVGPGMHHQYDKASLAEIMRRMAEAVEKGRDRFAKHVSLQTRTLRYNHMRWVTLTGLEQHWEDTRLDADAEDTSRISITTKNVSGFRLSSPWPKPPGSSTVTVVIDGKALNVSSDDLFRARASFLKTSDGWRTASEVASESTGALHKRHALQGPIDDAFMAPFLVVMPSRKCASESMQHWVEFELRHFQDRWRAVFRGDLRIKRDTEVTDDDIRNYHLILWGDPQANTLIARVVGQLPITWNAQAVTVGVQKFDAATHVPLLIYPNPLNPSRYVVLNSGPTFREDSDRTNSLQNPKLPDWAVIDITVPPDGRAAGKVVNAGFFDEQWKLKSQH